MQTSLMTDAERRAEEVYFEALRRKSGWDRIQMASNLYECLKNLTRSGIRAQHPEYTAEQVEAELRRRILGDALPQVSRQDCERAQ